jgi:peptidoglycan/xylan/chitin deacetylase (PgdA/CDA1 family)
MTCNSTLAEGVWSDARERSTTEPGSGDKTLANTSITAGQRVTGSRRNGGVVHVQQLRILTYHNVGTPPAGSKMQKLYVSIENFDRQCWLLRRLGMRGVGMDVGLRALRAGKAQKLAVLSFDDGFVDNLTNAAPILREYGFQAICYVVSGAVGGHNTWDAEQLGVVKPIMDQRAMQLWLESGNEIGSHTVSHPRLTELDDESARREIFESRGELQRITGTAVDHFCYPYGDHDGRSIALVRGAGYASAVTARRGPAVPGSDPFGLPRITVNRGRGLLKFGLHVATPYSWLRRQ